MEQNFSIARNIDYTSDISGYTGYDKKQIDFTLIKDKSMTTKKNVTYFRGSASIGCKQKSCMKLILLVSILLFYPKMMHLSLYQVWQRKFYMTFWLFS